MSRGRLVRAALLLGLLGLGAAGCDDQVKYVPWFDTMTQQPSVETFERQPAAPPDGTVPVDGRREYGLLEADTLLHSPLSGSPEDVARGKVLFGQFCTPCHGPTGTGDGPVVQRPRGIPFTPALNLHSDRARGLSDGYIWGMMAEGRGLMPSYRRIPPEDRWYVVAYVRALQTGAADGRAVGVAGRTGEPAASGSEGRP
ncbi:MAG: c-type cytochrome [Gemmatimonadota bacterium]